MTFVYEVWERLKKANPEKAEQYRLEHTTKKEIAENQEEVINQSSEELQKQELCKKLREAGKFASPRRKLITLEEKVANLSS